MKVIWKYKLEITDRQNLQIPEGAQLLSPQMQAGDLCLWAIVDPKAPLERREIEIVRSGNSMPEANRGYLGTAQMMAGALIWHVFEVIRDAAEGPGLAGMPGSATPRTDAAIEPGYDLGSAVDPDFARELELENIRLRAIFPKILEALGNGAGCVPECSLEFLELIPREVAAVVRNASLSHGDESAR